jgi:general secretion pathway protein G
MRQARQRSRFRALDLVATLLLVALSAAVVAPELEHRAALRRDARRLDDLHRVQDAIERFRLDTGSWPAGDAITAAGGWDASFDGAFLPELVERGYLEVAVHDPREDASFHFVYRRFEGGRPGCSGADGFYVLGIRSFETEVFSARRPGGLRCGDDAAWSGLAHVTGGGVDGG